MNTGRDGSLTTTHASSREEAVARLEILVPSDLDAFIVGGLVRPGESHP